LILFIPRSWGLSDFHNPPHTQQRVQNRSFIAICRVRGFDTTDVILAGVLLPVGAIAEFGRPKFGWFRTLNASPLSSSANRSVIEKSFAKPTSMSNEPGPVKMFGPEFPCDKVAPGVVGCMGKMKQSLSNQLNTVGSGMLP
jgi:hypothetical protein